MSKQYYHTDGYAARNSVGYLVKRAHGLILDAMEPAMAEHGLSFTQFAVLMSLRDNLAINPKDICTALRHDSGALTRVIDQLEERGWVERKRSSSDRRAIELHLTDGGREALKSAIPVVVDNLNGSLRDFSHAEIEGLLRLLNKLVLGVQEQVTANARDGS
ncbi:MAG: MarR family transcriptional regulator [Nevskia sp.]|nr:MarR family transcriptional regulator [Nevskia sp.]